MKRIAFFLQNLAAGGAERVTTTLANGIRARGVAVDVVLIRAEGPLVADLAAEVTVVDLRARRLITSPRPLAAYLSTHRPDALIPVMYHSTTAAYLARAIARTNTPIIGTLHSPLGAAKFLPKVSRFKHALIDVPSRFVHRRIEAVVAVSQGIADSYSARIPDRLRVIYNPVVSQDMPVKMHAAVDHPWFSPGQPPVIIAAGTLKWEKGFDDLLHAFRLVAESHRTVRLLIMGEGHERKRLEAIIAQLGLADRVALPGYVPNPFAYMKRAALFVLSSRSEGLPTVLIEAMACGLPIVATDCRAGPREILEGGKWGRLVPTGSIPALATAINAALHDTQPPAVAKRAEFFSVDRAVDAYLALCQDVASGARSTA